MSQAESSQAAREVHRLLLKACFSRDLSALETALARRTSDDASDAATSAASSAAPVAPFTPPPAAAAALALPASPLQGLALLHGAVLTGFPSGVRLLLAAGALPDARTGGGAAIRRTVQQYPGMHVKLVQRWWGGLRGGSTALALALGTLELVRRRERGDRDDRYGRFLAGYRLCIDALLEGGADPLLRADATGPDTVLGRHPRLDLLEAVLRRRLPWLLDRDNGLPPSLSRSRSRRVAVPYPSRSASAVAAGRRWLAGLTATQAGDLLCTAAAVGEPERAAELVVLVALLTPAQAEGMLRTLTRWHRYNLDQAQAELICSVLDACTPPLSAAALASADLAQEGLADLLCSVAEVPHLRAVQRLLRMGAPLTWDTLVAAVRQAGGAQAARRRVPGAAGAALAVCTPVRGRGGGGGAGRGGGAGG
ncbi:hypothetical protein ABPG75_005606 [Micractinium tetrahymenae]